MPLTIPSFVTIADARPLCRLDITAIRDIRRHTRAFPFLVRAFIPTLRRRCALHYDKTATPLTPVRTRIRLRYDISRVRRLGCRWYQVHHCRTHQSTWVHVTCLRCCDDAFAIRYALPSHASQHSTLCYRRCDSVSHAGGTRNWTSRACGSIWRAAAHGTVALLPGCARSPRPVLHCDATRSYAHLISLPALLFSAPHRDTADALASRHRTSPRVPPAGDC